MSSEEELNPYELLEVTLESNEQEIRTAYRQRSLKVHPDRNRGNPDAAKKFHELNQAYELLLDPLRRMALDAKMRLKEAHKARYAQYDSKRKNLVDELEERERAFKKAKVDKEAKQKEMWRENERIMEEGRILREKRERELQQKVEEAERKAKAEQAGLEPPNLGTLDTTVKIKYQLSTRPDITTTDHVRTLLSPFGAIESSEIVLSLKPAPPKKPKRGTALVPFKQVGDAFGAVCASGRMERGLAGVEVTWAEDKEPELIGWLKKMGKLGPTQPLAKEDSDIIMESQSQPQSQMEAEPQNATPAAPTDNGAFSSFPASFPSSFPDVSETTSSGSKTSALDYESVTLMRLRQAERERLEREIREREAQEK
ncbi:DnaJ-domain-containing protein [Phanerochaete sordida]|uniref:DnaJ-domain-containing protein n=1 Tax=Phanerochaete sordida TaxID=48140 RepID=A0A9P3GSJ0_9APHY|nr:DnaJ-domain-containing protein [Phanerochaete sordida]